jgi:glycosyltransferase involved in cell wall biosynthesis
MSGGKKKAVLLVTDTTPLYPPLWGGPKRIWGLYSNFPEDKFDITYVGSTYSLGDKKYSVNRVRSNLREILSVPPAHYDAWSAVEKMFLGNHLALDLFFYFGMKSDMQFRHILNSQNADIVVCSHPWSSPCIKKDKKKLFIYDAHNCEYLLMAQMLSKHPLRQPVLNWVRAIEEDACKKSDLILACSEEDKHDLADLYKLDSEKIVIVSNGTKIAERTTAEKKGDGRKEFNLPQDGKIAIFIGAYYKPNVDALKFGVSKIAASMKDWQFLVVGTVCDFFRQQKLPENIVLLGKLSEEYLDLALSASDVAINPMFSGSGVNIKMFDYMAHGLPVVSTDCGARGIETYGRCPMVIAPLEKFPENIRKLTGDRSEYARMSEDGRSLVAEHYDWENISRRLQEAIARLTC